MPTVSPEYAAKVLEHRKRDSSVGLTPDIYSWYRQIRQQRILFNETRGSWMVLRYADVEHVMLDHDSFSSQKAFKPDGTPDEILGGGMIGADPPRHRHLRALAAQAFTQKRIAQLEPRIEKIAARLLDALPDDAVDLVDALAFPLPVTVIGELLGVPMEDMGRFRQWSVDFVGNDFELRQQAGAAMSAYFNELIGDRTANPRQDLISDFLVAEFNGQRMTRADLIGMCLLLLIAGHETTASLITNALWCFDEHPHAWSAVCADPGLIPGAIEEVLRYRAVIHYFPRVVRRDMRYLEQDLKAGDMLLPMFAVANLDPDQFADPDRFDIHRSPNRHLGFGYGIHLCLGSALGRLEARISLQQLISRFPKLRRDTSLPIELPGSSFVYSLKSFPANLHG